MGGTDMEVCAHWQILFPGFHQVLKRKMEATKGPGKASGRCRLWRGEQILVPENLHLSPQWKRKLKSLRKESKPCWPQGTREDPLQL